MLATDGTWRDAEAAGGVWHAAVAPALRASVLLLFVVAVFLTARRVSGALDAPLAPLPLALTAGGLVAWAAAVRLRLRDRRTDTLAAAVLLLFAVACSFPGHRAIDWIVWLASLAVFGLLPTRRCSQAIDLGTRAEQVLQRLTRSRTAHGDVIHGLLVAELAPGERVATLHVAFCPPFEQLPRVEATAADNPECDVKVAQTLHQGARLEVRLAHISDAARAVTVEILATEHRP
jgi:hypothetical protein